MVSLVLDRGTEGERVGEDLHSGSKACDGENESSGLHGEGFKEGLVG